VVRGLASYRGAAVSLPDGVVEVHDERGPTKQVSLLVSSAFPGNHHSTIALYSSIALTRQHIITFSLLITTPPLLYTWPDSTLSHSPCLSPFNHCSILIYSPDQAAHYHILPVNHHSTIALHLARQHIITLSLLITIPPLLYTWPDSTLSHSPC
jgi:hypothetical protein